jgi:hypothetical protein
LKSKYYIYIIRALGIVLIVFALTLVAELLRLVTIAGI